ncbi:MAG: replicative DNA helicase [Cryobacterium sp.]|nr:replicative DNA helicase [Oligoflexia bacterium]
MDDGAPPSGGRGSRVPPHNVEAERSVLGAILLNNEAIHRVVEIGIEGRDFYFDNHNKIFDTLISLSSRGQALDLITLSAAMRDRGWYEQIGGQATLTSLVEDTFAIGNVVYYAKIVREKALLRRMIEIAGEITRDAFEGVSDVEGFLDDAEKKVFSVSDIQLSKSFSSMQDILVSNMHSIEEAASRGTAVTGLSTGFNDFDKLTAGLHPGQLIIVGGRPAMGKTSLVVSAAQNAALQSKAVVMIFSLEMSKEELVMRMLSSQSRIDSKRLRLGRLVDRDWPRLAQAADQLSKAKIFIDDSGDLTVMDMRARCRRLLAQEKKLDLIVVDYLQLMRGSKASKNSGGSRENEISEISRSLKGLAKELRVPIIGLSQLSRALEGRPDKRPMLSDLRESGAIEQDADLVGFVYRDEYYNKETEDKGVAEFIIAKHRAGETGTVRLAFMGEYTLFANLSSDTPGTPVAGPSGGGGGGIRPRGDVGL